MSPAPRRLALRLPEPAAGDPREQYAPGDAVFDAWMALAGAGLRPALVRPADLADGTAARRGITQTLTVEDVALRLAGEGI
nr:hypothetical protein OH826_14330 [Streptomyces sp. NBC_00899]